MIPSTLEIFYESPITHLWLASQGRGLQAIHNPHDIINFVCECFGQKMSDVQQKSRKTEWAITRQVCMYLIRKKTTMSLNQIGKLFNKHHKTVMHAIITVKDLMYTKINFRESIILIERGIATNINIREIMELKPQRPNAKNITMLN